MSCIRRASPGHPIPSRRPFAMAAGYREWRARRTALSFQHAFTLCPRILEISDRLIPANASVSPHVPFASFGRPQRQKIPPCPQSCALAHQHHGSADCNRCFDAIARRILQGRPSRISRSTSPEDETYVPVFPICVRPHLFPENPTKLRFRSHRTRTAYLVRLRPHAAEATRQTMTGKDM